MVQFLQDISANLMRTLRRPMYTLKAKQYQIVAVRGVLTDKEYQVCLIIINLILYYIITSGYTVSSQMSANDDPLGDHTVHTRENGFVCDNYMSIYVCVYI